MKTHLLLAVMLSLYTRGFSTVLHSTKGTELHEDAEAKTVVPTAMEVSFRIVELPAEFSSYDINKDGAISLTELSEITETEEEDASQPFHTADADGNNILTQNEFKQAPWVFDVPDDVINPVKEDKEGHLIVEKVHNEKE